jgi:hypothetical protein
MPVQRLVDREEDGTPTLTEGERVLHPLSSVVCLFAGLLSVMYCLLVCWSAVYCLLLSVFATCCLITLNRDGLTRRCCTSSTRSRPLLMANLKVCWLSASHTCTRTQTHIMKYAHIADPPTPLIPHHPFFFPLPAHTHTHTHRIRIRLAVCDHPSRGVG